MSSVFKKQFDCTYSANKILSGYLLEGLYFPKTRRRRISRPLFSPLSATSDFGTPIEQPVFSFIIYNRQAVYPLRCSVFGAQQGNAIYAFFLGATLDGR